MEINTVLDKIVADDFLHAKWLNTLSFMENSGARKISSCEDPSNFDIVQLKHAAEEHRHSYYLKKQIGKLTIQGLETYAPAGLLAHVQTLQYLHRLDVFCSRHLKKIFGLKGQDLKNASYLFVTYAIEVRADELYPAYQQVLDSHRSKVMVKSIILEEEGHLQEMTAMLEKFDSNWEFYAQQVQEVEKKLYDEWFGAITKEVMSYEKPGRILA